MVERNGFIRGNGQVRVATIAIIIWPGIENFHIKCTPDESWIAIVNFGERVNFFIGT